MDYKDTIIEDQFETIRRLQQEAQEKSNIMFDAVSRLQIQQDPKQFYYVLCGILKDEVLHCPKDDYNNVENTTRRDTIMKIIDRYCKFYGIKEDE